MSNVLAAPFKSSQQVDLANALRNHVEINFHDSSAHPQALKADYEGIARLREAAVPCGSKSPDVHPSQLGEMLTYYAQLTFLSSKFPADIGAQFSWLPIFDSQGISAFPGMLPAQMPISIPDLTYERACILYNIAAMYSALGAAESRSDGEGIKRALVYFQSAAGCFDHLANVVMPLLRLRLPTDYKDPVSPEFSKACLQSFSNLFLAQAQECFWQRAVIDKMKNGTISKLAAKVSELYETSAQCAQEAAGGGKDRVWPLFTFPWPIINHMLLKKAHFGAAAQYRRSSDDLQSNRYGDEIGRLKLAESLISNAVNNHRRGVSQAVLNDITGLKATLADQLRRATKDNDLIYLQPTTQPSNLPSIQPASMVTLILPDEVENPISYLHDRANGLGRPFFETLVPYSVHMAISIYDHQKEEKIRDVEAQLKELDQISKSTLQSLNLPAALDAIEQPSGLPVSLINKSEEVKANGGHRKLSTAIQEISRLASSNRSILEDCVNTLDAEETEDQSYRLKFDNQKWTRPPSSQLSASLRSKISKYSETMAAASTSDQVVRQKFTEWSDQIERLTFPMDVIETSIPSSAPRFNATSTQTQAVRKLRLLLEQLDGLSSDRALLAQDLKRLASTDDIRPAVLRNAGKLQIDAQNIKAEHFEDLFEEEMRKYKIYDHRIIQIRDVQAGLLDQITSANEEFQLAKQANPAGKQREAALQKLDTAHAKFHEILINLTEGQKFYTDFNHLLSNLRNLCRDFAQARRVESDRMIDTITNSLHSINLSAQYPDFQPGQQIRFG